MWGTWDKCQRKNEISILFRKKSCGSSKRDYKMHMFFHNLKKCSMACRFLWSFIRKKKKNLKNVVSQVFMIIYRKKKKSECCLLQNGLLKFSSPLSTRCRVEFWILCSVSKFSFYFITATSKHCATLLHAKPVPLISSIHWSTVLDFISDAW